MADTLKFGPEWLRALSDGNTGVGTPLPLLPLGPAKYKLADHRYGREEMLALFESSSIMPECLKEFPFIALEKAQTPLAILPVTEEEQRIMAQSVNSVATYRMSGRGIPPLRGRGGLERGRGRGRGRGDGFIQRGISYEESDSFNRPRPPRGDIWEEGGYKRFERRFEDTSAISPRKEYNRSLSSDNWRDKPEREEDDDGDWRRAGPRDKWGGPRGNWREAGRSIPEYDRTKSNGGPVEGGGFYRQRIYRRSQSGENWDEESNLPEWSMADTEDLDSLGTFDASGAFVSVKEAQRRRKEIQRPGETTVDRGGNSGEGDSEKDSPVNQTKEPRGLEKKPPSNDKKTEDKAPSRNSSADSLSQVKHSPPKRDKESESSTSRSKPPSLDLPKSTGKKSPKPTEASHSAQNSHRQQFAPEESNNISDSHKLRKQFDKNSNRNAEASLDNKRNTTSEEDTLLRLEKATVSMVATVTDEEHEDRKRSRPTNSPKPESAGAAGTPPEHDQPQQWFYRDPQGKLQGPFMASEMAEWFNVGYFTMNLLVKRGCDDIFQPLGELIKRWKRIPFLPGPAPPPQNIINSPVNIPQPEVLQQQQQQAQQQVQQQAHQQQQQQQEQMNLFQQHVLLVRQLQMQSIMQQLQQREGFDKLTPQQQQQLAMQFLCKQQQLLPDHHKLVSRSPPNEPSAAHPTFQRSFSQPADPSQLKQEEQSVWGDTDSSGNWSQATAVWDLEQPKQLEKVRIDGEELERLRRLADEEDKRQKEEFRRKQDEVRQKQHELRRQQEEMQRQEEEIERQKLLQRIQEAMRKEEEDKKRLQEEEEQRKLEEEFLRQQEIQRQKEIELRRQEELLQQQVLRQKELHRQQELERQKEIEKQQEIERQKELDRQKELERQKDTELQRQQEMQRRQELQRQQEQQRQQQEALRRLQQQQQDQLANIQLPASANWVNQDTQEGRPVSLAQIQQKEEQLRIEQERQDEIQRRQMVVIQQQQQQQQQAQQQTKSWAKQLNFAPVPSNSPKSLLEIQEEQARQLELEKQKKQTQQTTKPNLPLGAATVWGGGAPISSTWASEGAWGSSQKPAGMTWDEPTVPQSNKNNKKTQKPVDTNFPALGGKPENKSSNRNTAKSSKSSTKASNKSSSKPSRDEEAVQRLFRTVTPEDEFTQWCEKVLLGMATSVDVPTFVAFLQEVESPYEVHDYIKSYLGESKASIDFAKQFLEKRSYYKNKAKQQQKEEEDSIWGPAPAINPKESRPLSSYGDSDSARNKKSKGKKKMQKLDASILGFTVHAAPDRINVGQIEGLE